MSLIIKFEIEKETKFLGWVLQSVPSATNSRLSPLPHEPADFYDRTASVDIPLDSTVVSSTLDFMNSFVTNEMTSCTVFDMT